MPSFVRYTFITLSTLLILVIGGIVSQINGRLEFTFYPDKKPTKEENTSGEKTNSEDTKTKPETPEKITLLFVGDIMLSRTVGTKIEEKGDPTLPFKNTLGLLSSADLSFGNLESPFFDSGPRVKSGMIFKTEPPYINGLVAAGFDVLNLANNHIMNKGVPGLSYTLNWLKIHGINSTGAGDSFTSAHAGTIAFAKSLRVGFLGYSYDNGYQDISNTKSPVVAGMNEAQMNQDVSVLRQKVDLLIVTMHAGTEYTGKPAQQQISFARSAIDAGADLVIGHHPHVPQTIESYKNKWIFYSLGNFVFDQEWSAGTKEGLIASVELLNRAIKNVTVIPVIIENFSTPRLATDEESDRILKKIGRNSAVIYETR
jgi:poly-gamma-glutamate synthesis protein (capsule biosynthesis protein)